MTLTFDDAPHPEWTPHILQALQAAEASATFFVIGRCAERHPEIVRRIWDAGHEIGNHTWSHRGVAWELERTEELLAQLAPGSRRVFRPPFGMMRPGAGAALKRFGLTPVYWSVVPGDWNHIAPAEITRRVLKGAHPGAVIVLHGGHYGHPATAEALPELIAGLRGAGYGIVPLAQMLEAAGLCVGTR